MKTTTAKSLMLATLVFGLLASTGFAATIRVTGSVAPAIVSPGGPTFIHSGVTNLTTTNQAVTVNLTVNNPGGCVTGNLPSDAGAIALSLAPNETRLAALSVNVPPSTCSGTYSVTITVTNSAGTVLATHTATFTVTFP